LDVRPFSTNNYQRIKTAARFSGFRGFGLDPAS
jgi:hypothetical protein